MLQRCTAIFGGCGGGRSSATSSSGDGQLVDVRQAQTAEQSKERRSEVKRPKKREREDEYTKRQRGKGVMWSGGGERVSRSRLLLSAGY